MNLAREILDSLSLPLYLIREDFVIEEANSAGLEHIQKAKPLEKESGEEKKCYSLIYRRSNPCPFCPLLIKKEREILENTLIEKHIHDALPKVFRTKDNKQGEEDIENVEKSYRFVFSQLGQKKNYFLESIEDITAQQEKQDKLLLNENLSALGVMISGISHELNNSLTGMGLNLQNLIANHSSMKPEELSTCLEILRKDFYQASRIVSDILLFSSPSRPAFSKSKILQTIHKAIATTNRLYPVLSRAVSWQVSGEEIIFAFRPENIERLLINLFRNSLKAFDYKAGKIHVHLKRRQQSAHIIVEDNAGGIEKSRLKKIFQPFYSKSPDFKGSGLGLSICHSIVREHQGHIHARSLGERTFFYISLPLDLEEGKHKTS